MSERWWLFTAVVVALTLSRTTAQSPVSPVSPSQRTVAITVDDLPGAVPGSDKATGDLHDLKRWNQAIVRTLLKHNAPALGLVIGMKLEVPGERDARAAILNDWVRAGFDLGNHTYSHVHFSTTTLTKFEDDTLRGDVVTRAVMAANGKQERYFRHPAFSLGSTPADEQAFEEFLTSRGYDIAPVSVEDADYQFNDVMMDALAKKDKGRAAAARTAYLQYAQTMFEDTEKSSQQVFGRAIPQVLLIHDNAINAELLDTLLTQLERRGYRFVTLAEALQDRAYGPRSDFPGNLERCYVCWGSRLRAVGKAPEQHPSPPAWVTARFTEIRKASGDL